MMREISQTEVLAIAKNMVASATASIRMTMQATEEAEDPIPSEYFELLERKMREGVHVTRIGFGSVSQFASLASSVLGRALNYKFIRTDSPDYHRMLLVDETRLIFAIPDGGKRRVFYAENEDVVGRYGKYFERMLNDAAQLDE